MANGLLTNEELIDTLISDLNSVLKNAVSGQYIQACVIVTSMSQKLLNLKSGIKKDIDSKNKNIESLKGQLRELGAEVTDMSVEEYLEKHDIKKAVNENATT